MCGIGLWYIENRNADLSGFSNYMKSIIHRGPDVQHQTLLSDQLIIGNNRLAIIDQDHRSDQPMTFKNLTISFNGAIYNFKEIRENLRLKGHSFKTESDTEVVLHAFDEYGDSCVDHFDGMWSFIIYDKNENRLFCSRDRFGIKPFYYIHQNGHLFLASEVKQFYHVPLYSPEINSSMVQYFLESGGFKNYSQSTFLKGVLQLEPGHNLSFDFTSKELSVSRYYSLEYTEKPDEIYVTDFIKKSVLDRTIADVKPGMLFSGGLDSSIILGHLLQSFHKTQSYSFIETSNPAINEAPYVEAFVNQYQHINHQIEMPEQLDSLIRNCISAQDEPIASLSAVAQYLLYALAHNNGEKLMMSGQGADELFAGYPRNLSFIPTSNLLKNPLAGLVFIINNFSLISSRFMKEENVSLFDDQLYSRAEIKDARSYMEFLLSVNGLRDLLHYEDRNSMAHSVETRVPFLAHRLVEFAYHLEDMEKMTWMKRKGVLLDNYRKVLPKMIIDRKTKVAFDTPEKERLDQGFFDVNLELRKLKESVPSLNWSSNLKSVESINLMTQWQIYFMNIFLEIHQERLTNRN